MQKHIRFIEIEGERLLVNTPEEIAAAEKHLWELGEPIARVRIAFDGDFEDSLDTPEVIANAYYKSEAYLSLLS